MLRDAATNGSRARRAVPGQLVNGRYRIVRSLGEGGTGNVWLAADHLHGDRQVALKMIGHHRGEDAVGALLKHEFRVLSELRHPNIGQVYDFDLAADTGEMFFTREFVSGLDLLSAPAPTIGQIWNILVQVCRALRYIHSRGVIHFDVKPGNIIAAGMTAGSGGGTAGSDELTVKLIDFGLALPRGGHRKEEVRGTLGYMAPEILAGKEVDGRADLFSLGITLYRLLTGKLPVEAQSTDSMLRGHASLGGVMPKAAPNIPGPLAAVVERLMQPDPARRYRTPNDVISDVNLLTGSQHSLEVESGGECCLTTGGIVGRGAELDVLHRMVLSACRPERGACDLRPDTCLNGPAIALVRGEAGMGKRTIMNEIGAFSQLEGLRFVSVDCLHHSSRAFGAVICMLNELLPDCASLCSVSGRSADDDFADLVSRAREFLTAPQAPAAQPEADAVPSISVVRQAREQRMATTCRFLIEFSRRRPLVLSLGRADSSDPDSLDVLLHLARGLMSAGLPGERIPAALGDDENPTQLCVVCTCEPAHRKQRKWDRVFGILTEERLATCIDLGALSGSDVERMLTAMVGGERARPELVSYVLDASGGCPLLIEETVRALVRGKALEVSTGTWQGRIETMRSLRVPRSVRDAVEEKLNGLAPEAVRILSLLTIASAPLSASAVFRLSKLEPDRAINALEELRVAGLCMRKSHRDWVYVVLNEFIRQVVMERLSEDERRSLHDCMADFLSESSDSREDCPERIVRHRLLGLRPAEHDEAVLFCCRRLQERYASEAALEILALGRAVMRDVPRETALNLAERHAYVLALLGRWDESLGVYDEAVNLCRALGLTERMAENLLQSAGLLSLRHDFSGALFRTKEAREAFAQVGSAVGAALSLALLGDIVSATASVREAVTTLTESLALARRSGSRRATANSLGRLASALQRAGEPEKAMPLYEEARAIYADVGDLLGLTTTVGNMATLRITTGNTESGLDLLRQCAELADKHGLVHMHAHALMNLGECFLGEAKHEEARQALAEALRLARTLNSEYLHARCLLNLARVDRALKQYAAASEHLARSAAMMERLRDTRGIVLTSIEKAETLGDNGGWREALAELQRVQPHVRSLEEAAVLVEYLRTLAGTQHRLGLVEEAARSADEAVELAKKVGNSRLITDLLSLKDSLAGKGTTSKPLAATQPEAASDPRAAQAWSDLKTTEQDLAMLGADKNPRTPDDADGRGNACSTDPDDSLERILLPSDGVKVLRMVSRTLDAGLDLEPLLDICVGLMVEAVAADRGVILLCDTHGSMAPAGGKNISPAEVESQGFQASLTVLRRAVSSRRVVLIEDALSDDTLKNQESVLRLGIRSVICAPILIGEDLLGAVYLDSCSPDHRFKKSDSTLVAFFSRLIAGPIRNSRLHEKVKRELSSAMEEFRFRYDYSSIVGRCKKMRQVFDLLDKVVDTNLPILIDGETGTGKELVARAVHFNSTRARRRFVQVNCAAIPEPLLESELFGHVKGTFTGASSDKEGLFQVAHGGTLFLDEVANMSLPMQRKLLRALQDGEIRPLGARDIVTVDVRIIAASNVKLPQMVESGGFGRDLYYRLGVVQVNLPSLRERKEDVPTLVEHFLKRIAKAHDEQPKQLDSGVMEVLVDYDWPGNVRELENELRRAAALCGDRIEMRHFSEPVREHLAKTRAVSFAPGQGMNLKEAQKALTRQMLVSALKQSGGNKTRAAKLLGIPASSLYNKLHEFNIPE